MREELVKNIAREIPGYTGYIDWKSDDEKVRKYVSDKLTRLRSILIQYTGSLPPDAIAFINMAMSILDDIVEKLYRFKVDSGPEVDSLDRLIEIDHKLVELIGHITKILNNVVSGVSIGLIREYSQLLYRLSLKLKRYVEERMEILSI